MPTPILIEGFEHKVVSSNGFAQAEPKYSQLFTEVSGTTPTFQSGRTGQCLECAATSGTSYVSKQVNDIQVMVGSFYLKVVTPASPSGSYRIWFVRTAAPDYNGVLALYVSSTDGLLRAQIGSAYQDSSVSVSGGAWHRIDFRLDTSGTTWTCDWQVDGTAQTQVSEGGKTAKNMRYLQIGWASDSLTAKYHFDDIVLSSTSGDYPIGAHNVYALVPDGDGTHNAGTNTIEDQDGTDIGTAWSLLDEWPPNTSDYVRQSTIGTGNYAEVGFPDSSVGTIWGVEAVAALFSSGTNDNNGTTRIVDASNNTLTDVYAGDMSETSLHYRRAIVAVPGGGSWTSAKLNGLKARVGFSSDVTDVPRWSALMLQYASPPGVDYTEDPSDVETLSDLMTNTVVTLATRSHLRAVLTSASGDSITGQQVYVYEPNTTNTPRGSMWSAISGGNEVTNPITTDALGQIEVYLTSSQNVDIVWNDTAGDHLVRARSEPTSYIEFPELGTDIAAPDANYGRLYVRDNGSGKSQLVVRFSSGAVQVIATQP